MEGKIVVLRKWTGRIRTKDQEKYAHYVITTGLKDYAIVKGNLGYQLMFRALGDGTSKVTTLSWWSSMDSIREFTGGEEEIARYYPEDDKFLLDKPKYVEHYQVMAARVDISVGSI